MPSRINLPPMATKKVEEPGLERKLRFMNILSEEISSAWLVFIKSGSKDRCYTNNDALNYVMNMLSATKDNQKKFVSEPLLQK